MTNVIPTDWFDDLVQVWAFAVNDFQSVTSKGLRSGNDYPAQIANAGPFPVALSLVLGVSPAIGAGGSVLRYYGATQIYVTPNNDIKSMPDPLVWISLILSAAAANMSLGGKVQEFSIPDEENAIELAAIQFNEEDNPHWGFEIKWVVTVPAVIAVA